MRSWIALLALLPACGFSSGTTPRDSGPGGDDDAPIDASYCFGTFAPVCFSAMPSGAVALGGNRDIDTDNPQSCDQTHNKTATYCVQVAGTLTIPMASVLRAHGSKPLVLISATGTFNLSGTIDVSSKIADTKGAGADPSGACTTGVTEATTTAGGYGGSFESKGGDGSSVDGAPGTSTNKFPVFPTSLRGGCPGGTGAGTSGGAGGSGGGAVAIFAPEIHLNGTINASGAAGHGGGANKCGGGGGGAGGTIVLDASSITVDVNPSLLFANGGGGGQGGEGKFGGEGMPGTESTGPAVIPAGGTSGLTAGGGGGAGAYGVNDRPGDNAGNPGSTGGGGGGGGGAGFIHAAVTTGAIIAPPSRTIP